MAIPESEIKKMKELSEFARKHGITATPIEKANLPSPEGYYKIENGEVIIRRV